MGEIELLCKIVHVFALLAIYHIIVFDVVKKHSCYRRRKKSVL